MKIASNERRKAAGQAPRRLSSQHRLLFATAIYRYAQGRARRLRKSDVDLNVGLIRACRSYDHEPTKGGRATAIPIADELRPFLERAIAESTSDLVFPGSKGMMTTNTPFEEVLRRALARAGFVTGYTHVCPNEDAWPARTRPPRSGSFATPIRASRQRSTASFFPAI